uniref:Uncharacterized protein n=1 Tax=viral metagenome TaxID=1070528 RepID=A0A6M3Y3B6_9ZZZZ
MTDEEYNRDVKPLLDIIKKQSEVLAEQRKRTLEEVDKMIRERCPEADGTDQACLSKE